MGLPSRLRQSESIHASQHDLLGITQRDPVSDTHINRFHAGARPQDRADPLSPIQKWHRSTGSFGQLIM